MKLTKHLENWRADRPDEWKMDEFIRKASLLENAILVMTSANDWPQHVTDSEEAVIDSLILDIESK